MKKSQRISLSILATVVLTTGCAEEPTQVSLNREQYKSKEDCLRDWNSEQDCEDTQDQQRHTWYGPHYFYRGGYPYIYHGPDSDPTPVGTAAHFSQLQSGERSSFSLGRTSSIGHIARGGFGFTGIFRLASS
ncbi:MAG: hypothetical protein ABSA46_19390 [Thermodesulfovibrionales bacterium]